MPDEAGLRPQRVEFVPESTVGTPPTDPSFEAYSDRVTAFPDWQPDAGIEADRGVGSYRPEDFYAGPEDHSGVTINYRLQRWLVDGSGNAQDAMADGILRGTDGEVNNTHTFLAREDQSSGGAASGGRRIFYVGHGGYPASGELPFVTDSGLPIEASLTYQFEQFNVYIVDQPSSSTTLDVESTDSGDTTQTLSIENEDASTTDTVSLNGTTTVTSTESFGDIDALRLDAETVGDVLVKDGSGNTLARLSGQDSYDQGQGDLGIPLLGSGSHAGAVGSNYEVFLDDSLTTPTGDLGGSSASIVSSAFSFDNNVDADSYVGSRYMDVYVNEQTLELSAEVFGEEAIAHELTEHLQNADIDVTWTADGGSLQLTGGTRRDSGTASKEASQGRATTEPTLEFGDVTLA